VGSLCLGKFGGILCLAAQCRRTMMVFHALRRQPLVDVSLSPPGASRAGPGRWSDACRYGQSLQLLPISCCRGTGPGSRKTVRLRSHCLPSFLVSFWRLLRWEDDQQLHPIFFFFFLVWVSGNKQLACIICCIFTSSLLSIFLSSRLNISSLWGELGQSSSR